MRMFNALAMNEEDAVIPARRYLSNPRFELDLVRATLNFATFRRLFHDADRRVGENSGESKSDTDLSQYNGYNPMRQYYYCA